MLVRADVSRCFAEIKDTGIGVGGLGGNSWRLFNVSYRTYTGKSSYVTKAERHPYSPLIRPRVISKRVKLLLVEWYWAAKDAVQHIRIVVEHLVYHEAKNPHLRSTSVVQFHSFTPSVCQFRICFFKEYL